MSDRLVGEMGRISKALKDRVGFGARENVIQISLGNGELGFAPRIESHSRNITTYVRIYVYTQTYVHITLHVRF